jgi:hypothetical protein
VQAETDSDEVYAQIMLQPEADVSRPSYIDRSLLALGYLFCLPALFISATSLFPPTLSCLLFTVMTYLNLLQDHFKKYMS